MTLFDQLETIPVAHTGDAESSHESARRVTRNGTRGRHAQIVLMLVTSFPGKTATELWRLAERDEQAELVDHYEIRRRLGDLAALGLIVKGEQRHCSIKGTKMLTWNPS